MTTLFVGNLSPEVSDSDLRNVFSPYGEVGSIRVARDRGGRPRGFAFVELVIALLVAAVTIIVLLNYFRSTEETVKRATEQAPLSQSRLAADQATAVALRSAVALYLSREGKLPPDKTALEAFVNPPPQFQCPGQSYTYDPATGQVALTITNPTRC